MKTFIGSLSEILKKRENLETAPPLAAWRGLKHVASDVGEILRELKLSYGMVMGQVPEINDCLHPICDFVVDSARQFIALDTSLHEMFGYLHDMQQKLDAGGFEKLSIEGDGDQIFQDLQFFPKFQSNLSAMVATVGEYSTTASKL